MQRILIIKPSALGDVATTLPLLCDLRAAHPAAQIDWLVHPAYAAMLEGHDALHEAILFDRKKLAAWWYKPAAFGLFMRLVKTLRGNRYDAVIDAQGLFRSAFLARATGAKTRIGFAHAREGAPLAYTHKVHLPHAGRQILAVDRMRALGVPLGTNAGEPAEFRLPVQAAAGAGISDFVAVIPGARWNTKRWDVTRYVEIVTNLLTTGRRVVLLGSPEESTLCAQIVNLAARQSTAGSTSHLQNLAGQTTMAQMIALVANATLVIANDSGPLHVAAALGRPVVAIYGPTAPEFVGPYGQLQNVIRHDVPCHPCRRRECDHHSCMRGVSVELVWEKATRLLPTARKAGSRQ